MNDDPETLLRGHDPAEGKTLTAADRARTLQAARRRHGTARPRLALAFGFVAVVLGILLVSRRHEEAAPPPVRQIQYATPGGTRIVWTLDPRFHM